MAAHNQGAILVWRCAPPAVAVALCLFSIAAAPLSGVDDAVGAWDMVLDGSHRKCRVTLGPETTGGPARLLRFPAGCRRALPILNSTAAWGFENGLIRFIGKGGEPILAFVPRGDEDGLIARTATGEVFLLALQERPVQLQPVSTSLSSAGARRDPEAQSRREPEQPEAVAHLMPLLYARPVPPPTRIDPAKAPPPGVLPGMYVVDRFLQREVCKVRLGVNTLGASGRHEARLLDGCHDLGLRIFDPVAWRYEAGRLTLQARRGHEVTLVSERDGQWRRDPDVGATLLLRKAIP